MKVRALFLVLAVALTGPASAAEKSPPEKTAGAKARAEKRTPGKPAAKAEPSTSEAGPRKPAATPAQLQAVMRAKHTFVYASEACLRPGKCDEALREESKGTFMDACTACAAEEVCEQERDAILSGTAKGSRNPCVP